VTARPAVLGGMLGGVIACVLGGCGDNRVAPDAMAEITCTAAFTDNFTESSTRAANCPSLDTADGHATLRFSIPSQTIGAAFAIAVDLGEAATPGVYTAQNLATPWTATALHEFEMTSCLYNAGAGAVPQGTFRLVLDATAPGPHGSLDLVLYVLARPYTYCGETNVERLAVTF
jgi:hypothetical protein